MMTTYKFRVGDSWGFLNMNTDTELEIIIDKLYSLMRSEFTKDNNEVARKLQSLAGEAHLLREYAAGRTNGGGVS